MISMIVTHCDICLCNPQYLAGILNVIESTGCYKEPVATLTNSWSAAFHNVYSTVASDCHMPQGKNRHHKFKDKIVELWTTMERDVRDPSSSKSIETHPLYALAMKQLADYRAVAKPSDRKRPVSNATLQHSLDAAASENMIAVGNAAAMSAVAAYGGASPLKKARLETQLANSGPATVQQAHQGLAGFPTNSAQNQVAEHILAQIQTSLKRVEAVASFSTGPPKLPSPLGELHRILIGGMMEDPANKQLLTPYYNKCLAAYLRVAQDQADSVTTPGLLPGFLEGLELLMRHESHDDNMRKGLQYTYNYVLKAYLKLIEPQVKFNNHRVGEEAVL
jgi:hypothetical protein